MSGRRIDGPGARPRNLPAPASDRPCTTRQGHGASRPEPLDQATSRIEDVGLRALRRAVGRDPGPVTPELDATGLPRQDGALQLLAQKKALLDDVTAREARPASPGFALDERPADEPVLVTSQINLGNRAISRIALGPPRARDSYAFRGARQDAVEYPAQVAEHRFAIIAPAGDAAAEQVRDVARSLAGLSPDALRHVERVVINPVPNPEDAVWAERYDMPDFRSAMTAGRDGVITIYPGVQNRLDKVTGSLAHEIGHIVSKQAWGENYANRDWTRWKEAGRADGRAASEYATNSAGEDFAETYALYTRSFGSDKHGEYRRLFPHRFALIDQLTAG